MLINVTRNINISKSETNKRTTRESTCNLICIYWSTISGWTNIGIDLDLLATLQTTRILIKSILFLQNQIIMWLFPE